MGILLLAGWWGMGQYGGMAVAKDKKEEEIEQTLQDLAEEKTDILTLGQYLRPTPKHLPIDRWVTPEEFARWKERALELGFGVCESGPLVRSSYHAEEQSAKYTGVDVAATS